MKITWLDVLWLFCLSAINSLLWFQFHSKNLFNAIGIGSIFLVVFIKMYLAEREDKKDE